jgi:hypothetical protein
MIDTDPDPVPCPVCAGTGYAIEDEGYPIYEWCSECWGCGEIEKPHADRLARERASCVSISSYLDDR